jgi:AraC-like DNA-binding protein
VNSRRVRELLIESYHRKPGPAVHIPRHSHGSYVVTLNDVPWTAQYWYRRRWRTVPPRSVSTIPPGEVHAARDLDDLTGPATYRVFYLPAETVRQVGEQLRRRGAVFEFGQPSLVDPDLYRAADRLHRQYEQMEFALAQECGLLTVLAGMFGRRPARATEVCRARPEVARAKEYLLDNLTANVSLSDLSRVATLSPYHLNREFGAEVGLPPHAFHIQARIDRAKRLIAEGRPVGEVAQATGFFDQSHLRRHFLRIVGVTPTVYATGSR